jgi:hypothetical protein
VTGAIGLPDRRTRGVTAAIEGFFAAMWFSWGQAAAPRWLSTPLSIGSVVGIMVAVVGAVLAIRASGERTRMHDRPVRRRYSSIVGVEFTALAVGAAILAATGLADWIAVWVCAVVGVHFLPLSRILDDPILVPLGLVLCVIAGAALLVAVVTTIKPSTVIGPATGISLLIGAVTALVRRRGIGIV